MANSSKRPVKKESKKRPGVFVKPGQVLKKKLKQLLKLTG